MRQLLSLLAVACALNGVWGANLIGTFKDNDKVTAVDFTHDGKSLVTGSGSTGGPTHGRVKLWDVTTGKPRAVTLRFGQRVRAAVSSPAGGLLAVSTGGILQGPASRPYRVAAGELALHDATTGARKATLKSASLEYFCLAFSPDGKTLASGAGPANDRGVLQPGGVVRLWDVAKGKERVALKGHKGIVQAVAFSPDGKTLASASRTVPMVPNQAGQGEVKLWNVATGKETASLSGLSDEVWCVAFSPDGKLLATGGKDRTIRLWDVATVKEVASLNGHSGTVVSLAFSPDGKTLASAGGDPSSHPAPGEVRLWDVARRAEVASLKGHEVTAVSVAFSPDGKRLAAGGMDGVVTVWEMGGPVRP